MQAFQFRLQKALDWRRSQLELAEIRVREQVEAVAGVDRARAELEAAAGRAETDVRRFQPLVGGDLSALGSFRRLVKEKQAQLLVTRSECQKELAVRQGAMLAARRRCRLLERLKERRWSEWRSAVDRELEDLAADSYLAQWTRRRA